MGHCESERFSWILSESLEEAVHATRSEDQEPLDRLIAVGAALMHDPRRDVNGVTRSEHSPLAVHNHPKPARRHMNRLTLRQVQVGRQAPACGYLIGDQGEGAVGLLGADAHNGQHAARQAQRLLLHPRARPICRRGPPGDRRSASAAEVAVARSVDRPWLSQFTADEQGEREDFDPKRQRRQPEAIDQRREPPIVLVPEALQVVGKAPLHLSLILGEVVQLLVNHGAAQRKDETRSRQQHGQARREGDEKRDQSDYREAERRDIAEGVPAEQGSSQRRCGEQDAGARTYLLLGRAIRRRATRRRPSSAEVAGFLGHDVATLSKHYAHIIADPKGQRPVPVARAIDFARGKAEQLRSA